MERMTLMLDGYLQTNTPFSSTPPKAAPGSLARMPVYRDGQLLGNLPYINAAAIKGRLRRAARDVAREMEAERTGQDKPFNLETHVFNTLGGLKDSARESFNPSRDAELRARNPIASVFGCSTPWLAGRLEVGHALPEDDVQTATINYCRTNDLRRNSAEMIDILDAADIDRYLAKNTLIGERSRLEKAFKHLPYPKRKEGKAEHEAAVAAINDQIAALRLPAVSESLPMLSYEAIPAGVQMHSRIHLVNASAAEVGLLLAALDRFALNGTLGAHLAHGCGVLSGSWTVSRRMAGQRDIEQLGSLVLTPFIGLEMPDSLRDSLDAFLAASRAGAFVYQPQDLADDSEEADDDAA